MNDEPPATAPNGANAAFAMPSRLAIGAVGRADILERVFRQPVPRVILLQGPAGHGKTTLMQQIRSVFDERGAITGWMSIDEADNDINRLFGHLQRLLQDIETQVGTPSTPAHPPSVKPGRALRSDWMIERLDRLDADIAIFFDEFQTVGSRSILTFFRTLLERLPDRVTVVIGSRTVPEIGLARLVVNHHALVLRAQDLRFSLKEAEHFFAGSGDLALSQAELEAIYGRSEGWPAALQLYRLSLASPDVRRSLSDLGAFRPRELADYLADNVLALQSSEVQHFLRETAALKRLSGPLCDAVLERTGSQAMLQHLESAGLFLRCLDTENTWFKYHTLFSTFLVDQLREQAPERLQEIHLRAAGWLADNGQHEDAMYHAVAARDYGRAADVLDDWATQLIMDGDLMTVERWYDRLPLGEIESRPDLVVKVAYALAFLRRRQKLGPIDVMLERLAASSDPALAARPSLVRSMLLIIQDDISAANALIRSVDLHDETATGFRAFELAAGANLEGYLGVAAGDSEHAHAYLSLARAHSEQAGAAFSYGYSVSTSGVNLMLQGQLPEALEKFRQCIAEPRLALDESIAAASLVACNVQALYESNDLELAQAQFEQFHEVIRNAALLDYLASAYIAQARIFDAHSQPAQAQELLDEAESVAHASNWPRLLRLIHWERVRRALVRGEIERAHSIASRITPVGPPRPEGWLPFSEDCEGDVIGRIRLDIADGYIQRALTRIGEACPAAMAQGRVRRQIKLYILEALAQRAQGADKLASRAMQKAITRAIPGGFLRTFVDEGKAAIALLGDMHAMMAESTGGAAGGVEDVRGFVQRVLDVSGVEYRSQHALEGTDFQPLEALTEREQQILVLIAGGASNRKVSDAIFVSENTVKFHLKNIYSKLGVRSRAQAINAAHQMGLI